MYHRGMKKSLLTACAAALCLTLASCKIGDARTFDIKKDLTGLDLHYMQQEAEATSAENLQSIDGRLSGWPFWFAPVVTMRYGGSNALHSGEVEVEDKQAKAKISGFEHRSGTALGLGALTYNNRVGQWDADGDLERWESTHGLGWGILYSQKTWGDASGKDGTSTKVLFGMFGYTGNGKDGFLHFLWIPFPWNSN